MFNSSSNYGNSSSYPDKDIVMKWLELKPLSLKVLRELPPSNSRRGIEYRMLANRVGISPKGIGEYTQELLNFGLAIYTGKDRRYVKSTESGDDIKKDLVQNQQLNL